MEILIGFAVLLRKELFLTMCIDIMAKNRWYEKNLYSFFISKLVYYYIFSLTFKDLKILLIKLSYESENYNIQILRSETNVLFFLFLVLVQES